MPVDAGSSAQYVVATTTAMTALPPPIHAKRRLRADLRRESRCDASDAAWRARAEPGRGWVATGGFVTDVVLVGPRNLGRENTTVPEKGFEATTQVRLVRGARHGGNRSSRPTGIVR